MSSVPSGVASGDPLLQQRAPTPPGNIPKGRQTYIMIAVAVVIVLSIVFSGSATQKTKPTTANLPPLSVNAPTKKEIDAYSQQLAQAELQARQAKAQAERSKEIFDRVNGETAPAPQGGIPGQAMIGPDGRAWYPAPVQNPAPVAAKTTAPAVQEKEKLEEASLFASPVALSLRPTAGTAPAVAPVPSPALPPASVLSPDLKTAGPTSAASSSATAPELVPIAPRIPRHVLFEGTILEAVLTNRLDGSFSGPVNCMVTTNVYSHERNLLVIPQGSRVLGEARKVTEQQQERLAVAFHRLIMPDGYSVNLDQFLGLGQEGATGLKDQTNHHYVEIFGTSIALGVLSGFSQYGTGSALSANGFDQYRQGVASSVAQNNSTVLQRQLNRLPSITIREGQRVKIILTKDLELPAYAAHEGRSDL